MIRPFTFISLIAALGSGLYLYQEKHRAHLLDDDIIRTVHQTDAAHERTKLLEAEWALLNEQGRLRELTAQHLQLQPLQPTQFVRLEDLASRLPAVAIAPPEPDPAPVAAASPPALVAQAAAAPAFAAIQPGPAQTVLAAPPSQQPAQSAPMPAAKPAPRPLAPHAATLLAAAKPHEAEHAVPTRGERTEMARVDTARDLARPDASRTEASHTEFSRTEFSHSELASAEPRPERRRTLYAPMMPAYAPAPVVIHAPSVQTASAFAPRATVPFVGSALGMARTMLAAPVPVASGGSLGYFPAR